MNDYLLLVFSALRITISEKQPLARNSLSAYALHRRVAPGHPAHNKYQKDEMIVTIVTSVKEEEAWS
jgi:hypothetical protein